MNFLKSIEEVIYRIQQTTFSEESINPASIRSTLKSRSSNWTSASDRNPAEPDLNQIYSYPIQRNDPMILCLKFQTTYYWMSSYFLGSRYSWFLNPLFELMVSYAPIVGAIVWLNFVFFRSSEGFLGVYVGNHYVSIMLSHRVYHTHIYISGDHFFR